MKVRTITTFVKKPELTPCRYVNVCLPLFYFSLSLQIISLKKKLDSSRAVLASVRESRDIAEAGVSRASGRAEALSADVSRTAQELAKAKNDLHSPQRVRDEGSDRSAAEPGCLGPEGGGER